MVRKRKRNKASSTVKATPPFAVGVVTNSGMRRLAALGREPPTVAYTREQNRLVGESLGEDLLAPYRWRLGAGREVSARIGGGYILAALR